MDTLMFVLVAGDTPFDLIDSFRRGEGIEFNDLFSAQNHFDTLGQWQQIAGRRIWQNILLDGGLVEIQKCSRIQGFAIKATPM